jgi:hypothetical protein
MGGGENGRYARDHAPVYPYLKPFPISPKPGIITTRERVEYRKSKMRHNNYYG